RSAERGARRGDDRGAGGRADPGAARPRLGRGQPQDARRRAEDGGVRASGAAAGFGRGDQRPVRDGPRPASGDRPQGRDRGREEAPMLAGWIGDVALIAVVLPIVVTLLRSVLATAQSIVPSVKGIAASANAGSA